MSLGHDFGMIGLGTMGRNLVWNLADHGYSVAGLGRSQDKVGRLHEQSGDKDVHGYVDPNAFVHNLRRPRAIMLLVPAGSPVDDVINELLPLLDEGDLIIDGGNSYYKDTESRAKNLGAKKIGFFGMGVSGGASGARHGPSMMPGGPEALWDRVREMLEAVSAKAEEDGAPCVALVGPRGSGHYVKTVHNGIEYGIMQLIAEIYDIMKRGIGLSNSEIADIFESWDSGPLRSFLIHITYQVLRVKDPDTGKDLVDLISDKAKQKGTGKWTSQDAMDLGVSILTIDAAVGARELSGIKDDRIKGEELYDSQIVVAPMDRSAVTKQVLHDALRAGVMVTYAQGFAQLAAASAEYGYNLKLDLIARIWRAGCIIRSSFLQSIMDAYSGDASLDNLLLDKDVAGQFGGLQTAFRRVTCASVFAGIPVPALSASVAYFDSLRTGRLPANLIQAQRDYFGSHTYERIDKPGIFHTDWEAQA